jgi:SAM-dependent methyltransferase
MWNKEEKKQLSQIFKKIKQDLEPIDGKKILILCSAKGDIAFYLAHSNKNIYITGLELNEAFLNESIKIKDKENLNNSIEFHKAEKTRIPYDNEKFDAVISEFIVDSTTMPTEIGQPEMARVIKKGGKMLITDVIISIPDKNIEEELRKIGLAYICEATQENFKNWMKEAGLSNIKISDFSPLFRKIWEKRRDKDNSSKHKKAYSILLNDKNFRLGKSVFYIYIQGEKI